MMKPHLLILSDFSASHLEQMGADYNVFYAPDTALRSEQIALNGARFQVVLTIGSVGLTAAEIATMPQLRLICALGAGYEKIDIPAARQRGIVVTNGAGTNDACVADHAMGLLLAAVRGIPQLGVALHQGIWRTGLPLPASVSFKRLGILGLGTIGQQIAKRALGFDMEIGYHSRKARSDVMFTYFDSLPALAQWADFLVVATPGGAATRHLVNGPVLDALGPAGVLVNIARGSVVDTEALAQALRQGRIAAAGLDVYESEPEPPQQLMHLPNVVLTPHVAGWSPESVDATVRMFIENGRRHFSGLPVLTPV